MPEITGYSDHITPMVLLSLNTGMRQGELFSLEWESVDLTRKTITVLASHSKGNTTRVIPMNTEAMTVLSTIKPNQAWLGLIVDSTVIASVFIGITRVVFPFEWLASTVMVLRVRSTDSHSSENSSPWRMPVFRDSSTMGVMWSL